MSISICTGKLHRVWVTDAKLDYEGSITIDSELMKAAGILPLQLLHINSMTDAAHWETYAIPGKPGQGEICLNGCPAHLFKKGDQVIVLSIEQFSRKKAAQARQKVVFVDKKNQPVRILVKKAADMAADGKKPA